MKVYPVLLGVGAMMVILSAFALGVGGVSVDDSSSVSSINGETLYGLSLVESDGVLTFDRKGPIKTVEGEAVVYYTDSLTMYVDGSFGKAMSSVSGVEHEEVNFSLSEGEDSFEHHANTNKSFAFVNIENEEVSYHRDWPGYLSLVGLLFLILGFLGFSASRANDD